MNNNDNNVSQDANNTNPTNFTQETIVSQSEKKPKILMIIIILVIAAILGYFLYSKLSNKEIIDDNGGIIKDYFQEYNIEIDSTTLYNQNGIEIIANNSERGIKAGIPYTRVNFTISNNTQQKILPLIGARLYLNNIQIFSYGGGSCGLYIEPGEQRSNCHIDIQDKYLIENSINKKIETLRIPFDIKGDQFENAKLEINTEIKTKNYGANNQTYNFGRKVFEDDVIELQYVSVEDNNPDPFLDGTSKYDKKISFFVKNKLNKKIKMFLNDGKIFINGEEFKGTGMDINIIENGYAFVQAYAIYEKDISSINKIKFNIEYVDPDTVKTLSISNDCEFNIN